MEKKTSIPVAYTESSMDHGVELLKEEIRFYASVFDKRERGEKFIDYLDKTLALVRSRTADIPQAERKKVFNGYGPKHLVTLGGDTFMNERVLTAGCVDATAAISSAGKQEGLHSRPYRGVDGKGARLEPGYFSDRHRHCGGALQRSALAKPYGR